MNGDKDYSEIIAGVESSCRQFALEEARRARNEAFKVFVVLAIIVGVVSFFGGPVIIQNAYREQVDSYVEKQFDGTVTQRLNEMSDNKKQIDEMMTSIQANYNSAKSMVESANNKIQLLTNLYTGTISKVNNLVTVNDAIENLVNGNKQLLEKVTGVDRSTVKAIFFVTNIDQLMELKRLDPNIVCVDAYEPGMTKRYDSERGFSVSDDKICYSKSGEMISEMIFSAD